MNALLYAAWVGSFTAASIVLLKWNQKRQLRRRIAKGLRAYASGVEA
jgi:hypothetical protein